MTDTAKKGDRISVDSQKAGEPPRQGTILETVGKQTVVQALRQLDTTYADWMVTVYYRAEPKGGDPTRQLPRPAALQQRAKAPLS